MSSAHPKKFPIPYVSTAIAIALCLIQIASAENADLPERASGNPTLPSTEPVEIAAKAMPTSGALFASIIETRDEIDFLAGHKRYEDLIKVLGGFRKTLEQASAILPESDRQRAARFTAASRSLGQLSKALHSFMWKGQNEQLIDATDKLGQLLAHIDTLITPEERAQANAFQGNA